MTKYRKLIYSGICICGCSWQNHHGNIVASREYREQTGEGIIPGECERYGFNELAGTGPNGEEDHCWGYRDKDDPYCHECGMEKPNHKMSCDSGGRIDLK